MSAVDTDDRLDRAVEEAVAAFPPLSEDTKEKIAHLLRPSGDDE